MQLWMHRLSDLSVLQGIYALRLTTGWLIGIAMLLGISMMNPTAVTVLTIPLGALVLPWIGLFIGAIYPTVSATMLNSLKKMQHSPLTGWSIIFYAMGGAIGSRVLGVYYQSHSGVEAIQMLVLPLCLLLVGIGVFPYYLKSLKR